MTLILMIWIQRIGEDYCKKRYFGYVCSLAHRILKSGAQTLQHNICQYDVVFGYKPRSEYSSRNTFRKAEMGQ